MSELRMNYDLLIFDFDGTLANTFPWLISIINDIARKHNYEPINQDQLDEFRKVGTHKIIKKYKIPLWKIPVLGKEFQNRMEEDIQRISLFEGIASVLNTLANQGFTLALVSSNKEVNVKKVLGSEMEVLFSFFECNVPTFRKHTIFKKLLKLSKTSAERTLCIGDEIRDLEAAQKSGIDFGAVTWGYSDVKSLQALSPALIFQNVEDILFKLS
jgi:phosphoglycolate phosphatase